MPTGLLEVSGTIDLTQFWPTGESDADTVKVHLSGTNAFRFTAHPGAAPKVTHAFEGAQVHGKVTKDAIDKQQRIIIRLQAVDATELHYRPLAPTLNKKKPTTTQRAAFKAANGNFRQHLGETAAVELFKFLSKAGSSPIQCMVRTQVDEPGDVFDTFGRFIGDIFITIGGKEQDANQWLCENGWAFPTFYSSMTKEEIDTFTQLSEKARKNKIGIWKKPTSDLTQFDRSLVFRKGGPADPAHDVGPVMMPKLFRRRSTFGVAVIAKMTKGAFKTYLHEEPDDCFETADFLDQGVHAAKNRLLDEFVSPQGKFLVNAKDLVFHEMPSQVKKNGKPVQW
jgi:endonuclease YncB( thermonuclease family)